MMSKWHTYQSSCLSVHVTIAENSLMYSIHQKSNTIELTVTILWVVYHATYLKRKTETFCQEV
jgi:hypothetical protein